MKRIVVLLLLSSCMKTEIINEQIPEEYILPIKQRKELVIDTVKVDTTRVPITFNPTVEDWNETETEINT